MNTELQTTPKQALEIPTDVSMRSLEMAIGQGDFSQFSPAEKLRYLNATCLSVGLNPLTLPLRIIKMDGREVIYATAECSAQLSYRDKVSVKKIEEKFDHGCYTVRVVASTPDGRSFEDVGIVAMLYPEKTVEWINGQKTYRPHPKAGKEFEGLDWANGVMKAHTKASRRAILRICSLGIPDESEIDEMPRARVSAVDTIPHAIEESAQVRADKLNAALADKPEAPTVNVQVVENISEPPGSHGNEVKKEVAAPPAPVPTAPQDAPKPTSPNATTAATPAGLLSESEAGQLQAALSACPDPRRAVEYLEFRGWKPNGAGLEHTDRKVFDRIIKNTSGFCQLVTAWKGTL